MRVTTHAELVARDYRYAVEAVEAGGLTSRSRHRKAGQPHPAPRTVLCSDQEVMHSEDDRVDGQV
jgi:hypothetical protein